MTSRFVISSSLNRYQWSFRVRESRQKMEVISKPWRTMPRRFMGSLICQCWSPDEHPLHIMDSINLNLDYLLNSPCYYILLTCCDPQRIYCSIDLKGLDLEPYVWIHWYLFCRCFGYCSIGVPRWRITYGWCSSQILRLRVVMAPLDLNLMNKLLRNSCPFKLLCWN